MQHAASIMIIALGTLLGAGSLALMARAGWLGLRG
jgi:hypothetical protein